MNISFKDVYKPPFHQNSNISCRIDSSNGVHSFDIITDKLYPDFFGEHVSQLPAILACLNGEIDYGIVEKENIWNEGSRIYVWNHPMLNIRGFGYLTGIGSLQLDCHEACKIQDDFIEWIISKLVRK